MHTVLHALCLLSLGFVLAQTFLVLTKPPPEGQSWQPRASSFCESDVFTLDAHLHDGPTPPPRFWERNGERTTTIAALNTRPYNRPQDFASPALNISATPFTPIFFLHQPKEFVQLFKDCEADNNCYITHYQVPKKGGTSVEMAMAQIFNQGNESSCCNEWLWETFLNNTQHYCQTKFTSFQMEYDQFWQVIQTCFEQTKQQERRVLLLISFRSPIPTTLSFFHQRCNKNQDRRDDYIKEACNVCEYEYHQDVWDRLAEKVTNQLAGAWHVMHALHPPWTNKSNHVLPLDRMQVGLIEPIDLDQFLNAWHPEMEFPKLNKEELSRCYFRMTKEYTEKLAPAEEWYRRFVSGVAA